MQQGKLLSICDVFIKVGGSVMDDALVATALVPHIVALADDYRIVVMTGGGRMSKRIKANQRANHTDFLPCWRGATASLDINAALFASHSTRCGLAHCRDDIARCLDAGKVAVFAAAETIFRNLVITPDFELTTDSMGLYFAKTLRAPRYVIVSNVDGVFDCDPEPDTIKAPFSRLNVQELERLPSSKLDSQFPEWFRRYRVPTWVVNGKYPSRVSACIQGKATLGTEIVLEQERVGTGAAAAAAERREGSADWHATG